ncbi:hypothetical protein OAK01_03415 [Candidatus Nitrosopelagicus sp.]|nr:hypothetical protein [Candidatus Nitrosopelagicus sp.]
MKELLCKFGIISCMTMIFFLSSFLPLVHATHNENLYVSAENSDFENTFGGAQVVEVIVNDSSISSRISGTVGIPNVEVNGNTLAMVQASNGGWYGYFSNADAILSADTMDVGLEFGTSCSPDEAISATSIDDTSVFNDTTAVWISSADCDLTNQTDDVITVIRGAPSLNYNSITNGGQVGIISSNEISDHEEAWPWISAYNFASAPVKICYIKSGDNQCTTLEYYDTSDFVLMSTDRTSYPKGAQVEIEIYDAMLNIDPTSKDNWTFDFTSNTTSYNEHQQFLSSENTDLTASDLKTLGFDDGGFFDVTANSVLAIQSNGDAKNIDGNKIVFHETRRNSGIFDNVDSTGKANLKVLTNAERGTTGVITYNDQSQSILVRTFTGSVTLGTPSISEQIESQIIQMPDWVNNIFIWNYEKKISDEELINGIEFLVKLKVVQLD